MAEPITYVIPAGPVASGSRQLTNELIAALVSEGDYPLDRIKDAVPTLSPEAAKILKGRKKQGEAQSLLVAKGKVFSNSGPAVDEVFPDATFGSVGLYVPSDLQFKGEVTSDALEMGFSGAGVVATLKLPVGSGYGEIFLLESIILSQSSMTILLIEEGNSEHKLQLIADYDRMEPEVRGLPFAVRSKMLFNVTTGKKKRCIGDAGDDNSPPAEPPPGKSATASRSKDGLVIKIPTVTITKQKVLFSTYAPSPHVTTVTLRLQNTMVPGSFYQWTHDYKDFQSPALPASADIAPATYSFQITATFDYIWKATDISSTIQYD